MSGTPQAQEQQGGQQNDSGSSDTTTAPKFEKYGIILFRAFDILDIYGPLEILQLAGKHHKITVSLISTSLSPVITEPLTPRMNPMNSSVYPSLPPTHTLETAPKDLDVLIIPGGPGMRNPDLEDSGVLEWIRETAPKVKHVLTICTGSGLAARAGIMDGRRATTNKWSWPNVTSYGPNTNWIGNARWVEDNEMHPPIWSSSGVTAGFDLMLHFVESFYAKSIADGIATLIEYQRNTDPENDPFAREDRVAGAAAAGS